MTCQLLHMLVQHLAMLDVASLAVKVLYKLLKRQISSSLVTALATIISFSHSIVLLGQSSLSLELPCNNSSNIRCYLILMWDIVSCYEITMDVSDLDDFKNLFYDHIKIL